MECNVCGTPGSMCQEDTTRHSYFYAYLNNNYLESVLNSMVGKLFLALDSSQEEHVFKLNKGMYTTHIFSDGYREFITSYDLKPGDRIRVELDHPPPHFIIKAEGIVASPGKSDDDSEYNAAGYEGTISVFTKGLKLTDAQAETMNNRVTARGIGMGVILVHKLTESDVHNNGLHIPKRVVYALKINKKGWFILRIGDNDDSKDAEYYRSTDGRIRFKSGWAAFVDDFDIEEGLVVLVMFHKDDNGYLNITFDVP